MSGAPSIIDTMESPALFEPWFQGESWTPWKAILKAAFALPMGDDELWIFRSVSGGRNPPTKRVRELWIIAGRRAGKDSIASLITAYAAALFSGGDKLRPGERAAVQCIACDREQARIVLNYTRAFFEIELFKELIERETRFGFQLSNNVDIEVSANSFRRCAGGLCSALYWTSAPTSMTIRARAPMKSCFALFSLVWRHFRAR